MSITDNIRDAKRYRAALETQADKKVSELSLDELEKFIEKKEEEK